MQSLEQTLPKELQNLPGYGGPLEFQTAIASHSEPLIMDKIHTADEIKAIATAVASTMVAEKDNQVGLVGKISGFLSETNVARTAQATAELKVVELERSLAEVKAEAAKMKTDAEAAAKDKKADKEDKDNIIAKFDKAKSELTEAKKTIADASAEKTIAKRTAMLDSKKMTSKARLDKASARNEQGEFILSEAAFEEYVADIEEAITSAVAKFPPADKDAADKDAADKAAKDKAAKDAKDAADKKAKAGVDDEQDNEGGKLGKGKASVEAVPALPDVSQADVMAQATAALMGGVAAKTDQSRITTFANVFKI